jgi:hypothetical protein
MGEVSAALHEHPRGRRDWLRRRAREFTELAATARDPVIAQELRKLAATYRRLAGEMEPDPSTTRMRARRRARDDHSD